MTRVGVFGGIFNPIHRGHMNSLAQVKDKFQLDMIRVIPAYQSPGKDFIHFPKPEQRLEMVKLSLKDLDEGFLLDPCEINRQGMSYSIDTLKGLLAHKKDLELFLIIGLDQFYTFDQWKDYGEILGLSNIVVTSRPGYSFPLGKSEFPKGFHDFVEDFDIYQTLTKFGKGIYFIRLSDVDVSSSKIRKKLKLGQSVDQYLSFQVENYIKDQSLYQWEGLSILNYLELSKEIASLLDAKDALNTMIFDFTDQKASITDHAIVCSANNKRQTVALSEFIIEHIKDYYGTNPLAIDGQEEGRWVVLDYGNLIIHIFYDFIRQEFHLEQLWKDAKRISFQ